MDDVVTLYAVNGEWDHDDTLRGMTEDCYLPPLRLEKGSDDVFLETQFRITEDNRVQYWLKNDNMPGRPPAIWRYAHIGCYSSFAQKRTTLMACLRKVHNMASDATVRVESARRKILEFLRLGYPAKMMWTACTTMGVHTRDPTWFRARGLVQT